MYGLVNVVTYLSYYLLVSNYQELIYSQNFTYMLPCIVTDFFLNNQPDALIIQIYSLTKLYMFQASSLSIIRSFPLYVWRR